MVNMNRKRGNIGVILFRKHQLKEPTFFVFEYLFEYLWKVMSLRQFLDFLVTFSYKWEKNKYRYIKCEQHSISLIFLKCNTVPLKSEPPKNPEIIKKSKIKIYRKASFLIYFRILPWLYVVLSIPKHCFLMYWAAKAWTIFEKKSPRTCLVKFLSQLHTNIGAIKCYSQTIICARKSLLEMRKIILSKIDFFNFGITLLKWAIQMKLW